MVLMVQYRVTFQRIGRNHQVRDLLVSAANEDHLAGQILRFARPYLLSREVTVMVSVEEFMRGEIICGVHQSGGSFTIAVVEEENP